MTDHDDITAARGAFYEAKDTLYRLVDQTCPAEHHRPVQHRDRKPPWCEACGRSALGVPKEQL